MGADEQGRHAGAAELGARSGCERAGQPCWRGHAGHARRVRARRAAMLARPRWAAMSTESGGARDQGMQESLRALYGIAKHAPLHQKNRQPGRNREFFVLKSIPTSKRDDAAPTFTRESDRNPRAAGENRPARSPPNAKNSRFPPLCGVRAYNRSAHFSSATYLILCSTMQYYAVPHGLDAALIAL